jgi:hypothetical protein
MLNNHFDEQQFKKAKQKGEGVCSMSSTPSTEFESLPCKENVVFSSEFFDFFFLNFNFFSI